MFAWGGVFGRQSEDGRLGCRQRGPVGVDQLRVDPQGCPASFWHREGNLWTFQRPDLLADHAAIFSVEGVGDRHLGLRRRGGHLSHLELLQHLQRSRVNIAVGGHLNCHIGDVEAAQQVEFAPQAAGRFDVHRPLHALVVQIGVRIDAQRLVPLHLTLQTGVLQIDRNAVVGACFCFKGAQQRSQCLLVPFQQQIVAAAFDRIAGQFNCQLAWPYLVAGIGEQLLQLTTRCVCARVHRCRNHHRSRGLAQRTPVVAASIPLLGRDGCGRLDAHCQTLAVGSQPFGHPADQAGIVCTCAGHGIDPAVVDQQTWVPVGHHQLFQGGQLRLLQAHIDQQVVDQVGAYGLRFDIGNDRHRISSIGGGLAVETAISAQVEDAARLVGHDCTFWQLALQAKVQSDRRHARQCLNHHKRLRHIVETGFDHVGIGQDTGRQILPELAGPFVDGQRLVRQAVVGDRDRDDRLQGITAARFDLVDRAFGDQGVGQRLRGRVQIVASPSLHKISARHAAELGLKIGKHAFCGKIDDGAVGVQNSPAGVGADSFERKRLQSIQKTDGGQQQDRRKQSGDQDKGHQPGCWAFKQPTCTARR